LFYLPTLPVSLSLSFFDSLSALPLAILYSNLWTRRVVFFVSSPFFSPLFHLFFPSFLFFYFTPPASFVCLFFTDYTLTAPRGIFLLFYVLLE